MNTETNPAPLTHSDIQKQELQCPHCGRQTHSLKRYDLWGITFLIAVYNLREKYCVACPHCMRKAIWKSLFNELIYANVTWPILFFRALFLTFASYMPGHSKTVVEIALLEQNQNDQSETNAELRNKRSVEAIEYDEPYLPAKMTGTFGFRRVQRCAFCGNGFGYTIIWAITSTGKSRPEAIGNYQKIQGDCLGNYRIGAPCPHCGCYQPEYISTLRTKWGTLAFLFGLVFSIILAVFASGHNPESKTIAEISGRVPYFRWLPLIVVPLVTAFVLWFFRNRNQNTDKNLDRIRSQESTQKRDVFDVRPEKLRTHSFEFSPVSMNWYSVAIAVFLMGSVSFFAADIWALTNSYRYNPALFPPVFGPGDRVYMPFNTTVKSIQGQWSGNIVVFAAIDKNREIIPTGAPWQALVENEDAPLIQSFGRGLAYLDFPELGEPDEDSNEVPLKIQQFKAVVHNSDWGNKIETNSQSHETGHVAAKIIIPKDPELENKTLLCQAQIGLVYPVIEGKEQFNEESDFCIQYFTLNLSAAKSGSQYWQIWKYGTLGGALLWIVFSLMAMFPPRAFKNPIDLTVEFINPQNQESA